MDKREAQFVERQVSMGLFQLSVAQLITLFKSNGLALGQPFVIESSIVDDKIIEAKVQDYAREERKQPTRALYDEYVKRAITDTHKGQVKFEIRMNQFSEALYTDSVFHIQDFQARTPMATHSFAGAVTALSAGRHQHHHRREQSGMGRGEPPVSPAPQPSPVEDFPSQVVTAFQPLSHTSQLGHQRMLECLEGCVLQTYCRKFMKLNQYDADPEYAPANDTVKNLQFPMWVSKMGRTQPVISYFSCHDPTTRVYHSEEARRVDLAQYGFNAATEHYFLAVLNASLRRMGLSAEVFEREVRNHFSVENRATTLSPLFALCEEAISRLGTFAANCAYYTADYRMVRDSAKGDLARMIVLDSWDNTILNDAGRSDDCEGQDNTATTIIRAFGTGRYDLNFQWESPVLNAVKLYLAHSVIYDVGATVTSAFYNTSNEVVDLRKAELPMVGDAVDVRSKADGHCHGFMEAWTNMMRRVENGNMGASQLALVRARTIDDAAFQQRDALRGVQLIEGTGTVEPRQLPLEEAYAGNDLLTTKKRAERLFIKALRARMAARKLDAKQVDLSEMFNGEGLPHYVAKQHPQRRISDFYKEPVMGCSVELYQLLGFRFSQFAFTRIGDDGKHRYGVSIGDFMRTTDRYGLIFPFAHCDAEWEQKVAQMTECVQHQLPLMAFGRYNERQYGEVHSRFLSLGATKTSQQEFEQVVHNVATDPTLSIVRLQTRQWRLDADETKTVALRRFIGESQGLVTHAFYSEHHLPVCDPMIEILCVIHVPTCLQFKDE